MWRLSELVHLSMHAAFDPPHHAASHSHVCGAVMKELVLPVVVSGQSTVIAAETGSGKTLAYLVPIASLLIRQKERLADDPT